LISPAYALLSLFFIVNFALMFHIPSDGPFWSLAVEEQFYLFWPLFVRKVSLRNLGIILWFVILAEPVIRYFLSWGGHAIAYYTFSRGDGLAWGALLAIEARSHRVLEGSARAAKWWRAKGCMVMIAGAVMLAFGIALSASPLGNRWSATAMLSACPVFFTGLVSFILTHRDSWVSRWFSNRVLRFIGDISYCSYLVHLCVLRCYDRLSHGFAAGDTTAWFVRAMAVLPRQP
jgi:peptidoglycan/LPS O-acetylase OafA/YrhL